AVEHIADEHDEAGPARPEGNRLALQVVDRPGGAVAAHDEHARRRVHGGNDAEIGGGAARARGGGVSPPPPPPPPVPAPPASSPCSSSGTFWVLPLVSRGSMSSDGSVALTPSATTPP